MMSDVRQGERADTVTREAGLTEDLRRDCCDIPPVSPMMCARVES